MLWTAATNLHQPLHLLQDRRGELPSKFQYIFSKSWSNLSSRAGLCKSYIWLCQLFTPTTWLHVSPVSQCVTCQSVCHLSVSVSVWGASAGVMEATGSQTKLFTTFGMSMFATYLTYLVVKGLVRPVNDGWWSVYHTDFCDRESFFSANHKLDSQFVKYDLLVLHDWPQTNKNTCSEYAVDV